MKLVAGVEYNDQRRIQQQERENADLVSPLCFSVRFSLSASSRISFATFRILLVMEVALISCIPSGLEFLLCRGKSRCMVLWTWRKAFCSQRETSVNFVSNPFSGAGPAPKNPHSHKKLARSQNFPCSQLTPAPVVYFISSVVNTENQSLLLFQAEPNRGEFVLYSILRLSIFILLQWKAVPNT